jgi:hypothetical protein
LSRRLCCAPQERWWPSNISRRIWFPIGEFGSGWISAFDAVTGQFIDNFKDQNNAVISIGGPGALWSLAFGDGEPNSDPVGVPPVPANALYFTAGPMQNGVFHGLFGTLTPIQADLTQGSDQQSLLSLSANPRLHSHGLGESDWIAIYCQDFGWVTRSAYQLRRSEIFIAHDEKNGELRRSDIYLERWPDAGTRSQMPLLTELSLLKIGIAIKISLLRSYACASSAVEPLRSFSLENLTYIR